MLTAIATILTVQVAQAGDYSLTPDGSYVGGSSYSLTPDGTYVGTND